KQRMQRITAKLHEFLPGDYRQQLGALEKVAAQFGGLQALVFPDFVAAYGLDDFEASVPALEQFTPCSSSEFAVRPFIVRYCDRMLAEALRGTRSENEHVRRLASEGSFHGRWLCRNSSAIRARFCRSWTRCAPTRASTCGAASPTT